jgi:hypothetical protein
MMAKRIILAAVLAGMALFAWQSISHMVVGLGEVGIREIPNEDAVLAAMRQSIPEPGFYFFPGMRLPPNATKEQQQAAMKQWEAKYTSGPAGILIYHPRGEQPMSPKQLLGQLAGSMVAALIAGFLLSRAVGSLSCFASRIGFVVLLGLLPSVMVHFPYWNWYGFPTSYSLAALTDHILGFAVMGAVLAAFIKQPAT